MSAWPVRRADRVSESSVVRDCREFSTWFLLMSDEERLEAVKEAGRVPPGLGQRAAQKTQCRQLKAAVGTPPLPTPNPHPQTTPQRPTPMTSSSSRHPVTLTTPVNNFPYVCKGDTATPSSPPSPRRHARVLLRYDLLWPTAPTPALPLPRQHEVPWRAVTHPVVHAVVHE